MGEWRSGPQGRQGKNAKVDRSCGRMSGLLQVLGVVHERDHFCAPGTREVGFCPGKVGLVFFIFRARGVARKWSLMRVGGLPGAGGGMGAGSCAPVCGEIPGGPGTLATLVGPS
jgi:hypothetical protein